MANDLIRTMWNKGLTEADVSPSAAAKSGIILTHAVAQKDENACLKTSVAAGSKLLKGGITLMQNYSQLVASPSVYLRQMQSELRVSYETEMDTQSLAVYLRPVPTDESKMVLRII